MRHRSELFESSRRGADIAAALERIVSRRIVGEDFSDADAIRAFPDLMPELGERLRELGRVEAARRAAGSSDADTLGVEPAAGEADPAGRLGSLLPGYEIESELSRGGQGVVYRAVQRSTRRRVAIKVLREGAFAGSRDRARFEREVQVLARLRHPNIVTIHDSGVADGHFYFVMDYVEGRPLSEFVTERGLGMPAALALFADVCDAVHAAHLRGVIHRDLKPSNVLVSLEPAASRPGGDDAPGGAAAVPKVLDFGLAKLAGGEWEDSSGAATMTDAGQFVGSLPWASPEQAAGRVDQIDVRTDVYSLGVMLYHALTGSFPYRLSGNLPTMLGRILADPPVRPSAQRRGLSRDVDTIILRCLAKEPERRYQSAGELGADLRRCLAGAPIDARRDDAWYVLGKTLRRYRVAVGVAAAFVLVILASTAGLWTLYRTSERRADEAQRARIRAEGAEKVAQARKDAAEIEAARARDFQAFLQKLLSRVRPSEALGAEPTLRQFLDEAAQRTESELATRPEVQGALLDTIGTTYAALGLFDKAEAALRRALALRREALGPDHADVAATMHNLAQVLRLTGRYPEATTLLHDAVAVLERAGADAGALRASCLAELAQLARRREALDEAEAYASRATALAEALAPDSLEVAMCLDTLAGVRKDRREFEAALSAYERALGIQRARLPALHPDIATTLNNIGSLLDVMGRFDDARRSLEEALEQRTRLLPPGHADWAATVNNLARVHASLGDAAAAEAGYREVIEVCRRTQGPSHPFLSGALYNLAELLAEQGKPAAAEPLYREALDLDRVRAGDRSAQVGDGAFGLGTVLFEQGRYGEAEPYFREALSVARAAGDRLTCSLRADRLASALQNLGRLDESESHFRAALEDCRSLGAEAWRALTVRLNNLALLLKNRGALDEAERLYRESLELRRANLSPDDPLVASSLANLGMLLLERREYGLAESMLRESLEIRRSRLGPGHADTHLSLRGLAAVVQETGRHDEAESLYRECVDRASAELPQRQMQLWAAQVAYGRFLVRRGRLDEAEARLRGAFDEMSARFPVDHAPLRRAIEGLIELHEARGETEAAARLRARIDARPPDSRPAARAGGRGESP